MQRRTIDLLVSGGGLMLAVVLIVFGVYFNDRYQFAENNVHDQLADQRITFPPEEELTPEEREQPGVVEFAGQPVDDGEKAEVYANEFIALHLSETAGGKTYAELGGPVFALQDEIAAAEEADPNDPELPAMEAELAELRAQRNTVFTGETLRGLLLTTYGFWQFGQEAQLASIASFAGAAVLLLLVALGVWHALRSKETAQA